MPVTTQSTDLKSCLRKLCEDKGAAAFGVAAPEDADALPRIRIVELVTRWSKHVCEVMPGAKSVIIFGVPSLDDADELEIRRGERKFSYPGYGRIVVVQRELVRYLTSQGYSAKPVTELVPHKRLAVLAGIGAYGKNSLIISPRLGPWLRFGAVATDAPIPKDKAFTKDMCGRCRRCVTACPSGALKPYVVDPHRCLVYVGVMPETQRGFGTLLEANAPMITPSTRKMCTRCQMACPYTTAERRRNVLKPSVGR